MACEKSAPRIRGNDFPRLPPQGKRHIPRATTQVEHLRSRPRKMCAKVRAVLLHHSRSMLKERTWFNTSYRGAMDVNISRTARAEDCWSVVPSGVARFHRSRPDLLESVNWLKSSFADARDRLETSARYCTSSINAAIVHGFQNYLFGYVVHDFHFPYLPRQHKVDNPIARLLVRFEQAQNIAACRLNLRQRSQPPHGIVDSLAPTASVFPIAAAILAAAIIPHATASPCRK